MHIGGRDWKAMWYGFLEISLVAAALVSILTVFDDRHRYLELVSHFRLQYFVVSVLLTGAFLWLRWPGYVALGVATTALNAWFIVPWYLPIERGAAANTDIRILNANVLATNGNYDDFRQLVESTQPDIVIMQEVTEGWLKSLDGFKTRYPYKVVEARNDPFGIALFSRYPLDASAIRNAAPRGYPEIIATVLAGDRRLQLIATHPANPVANGGYFARNVQLDGVGDLAMLSPTPLIVAGDLNVSVWSNHYRRLVAQTGLRNAREGFGVKPTWPTFFPVAMIPIDHFLVSADVEVTGFETGPSIGSDHLPVTVTVRLRDDTG
jgi:endonuclease/exonuclease/phosphatase (EEP) superfamily protein YafD